VHYVSARPDFFYRAKSLIETLPTKKRAKVLLFFDMTKYFGKKMHFWVIFLVFALSTWHFSQHQYARS